MFKGFLHWTGLFLVHKQIIHVSSPQGLNDGSDFIATISAVQKMLTKKTILALSNVGISKLSSDMAVLTSPGTALGEVGEGVRLLSYPLLVLKLPPFLVLFNYFIVYNNCKL